MKALFPGHTYELDHLKDSGKTIFCFYRDPGLHDGDGQSGPSCQEVIRMLIDRVTELDKEAPWPGNKEIINLARGQLALFEARALLHKVAKGEIFPEELPLGPDGHIIITGAPEWKTL